MQTRNKTLPSMVVGSLILFSVGVFAQSASTPVTGNSADNTATNQRDRADTIKPTDQSNSKADIQVAATVRRAIVADRSLSTKAHNVKLVANGGAVTLRGPVDSDAEKSKIEEITKGVVGVTRVENDLDVKNIHN
jgi:hyperosmotically inducible protein